jgi:hypothetical protein
MDVLPCGCLKSVELSVRVCIDPALGLLTLSAVGMVAAATKILAVRVEQCRLFRIRPGAPGTVIATDPSSARTIPYLAKGSQKVVHEYLVHPSELKTLETGQAVFKSGGRYGRLILPGYFPQVEGVAIPDRSLISSSKSAVAKEPSEELEVPF